MGRRIINDDRLKELLGGGKSYREIGRELGVSAVAICKRVKRLGLLELPKSLESLTPKEQKFAIAVAGGKSRISAVMETYDVTSRESAKALQNTLMKNPEIKVAIDELMELKGIGREFRVVKLGEHMRSHDPVISLKALDMGFKIADEYPKNKQQETTVHIDLASKLDEARKRIEAENIIEAEVIEESKPVLLEEKNPVKNDV